MNLAVPELSLVVLVGVSGSGKSTFASTAFRPSEVLSSDHFRELVANDAEDQAATPDAFAALHFVAARRLARGLLTVVDATNVQPQARKPLIELAREHDVFPVAIVLDVPLADAIGRNGLRADRTTPPAAIRRQHEQLQRSIRGLRREGFRFVHVLTSVDDLASITIERERAWNDRRDEVGPFDIIGDVHGCFDELHALLDRLGYKVRETPDASSPHAFEVVPPAGRRAIFLGDLVDRGPDTPRVLGLVMSMVQRGVALAVTGNHDAKLVRALRGNRVQTTHGLAESLEQLAREPEAFRAQVAEFLDGLVAHYVLDGGKLVVAHAGMKEHYQGRTSGRVRDFALYGETTGETDEFGLPVRFPWAQEYRGAATVVYGHTPVLEPAWVNRTICVDTGCVFGGKLTALRYPENELVSIPAARIYYEPIRPLGAPGTDERARDLLDITDVTGKRIVSTTLAGNVTILEEQAATALEVMTRWAIDPRWLVYLPPTMSPPETSKEPGLLEHPAEAFAYYRKAGLAEVVCEEKHMGSRAIVVICRDPEVAARSFAPSEGGGAVYTRTGRRFFEEPELERGLLERVRSALTTSGTWDELDTDWLAIDGEIMPWSYKAHELIQRQYVPVGVAATHALAGALGLLRATEARGVDASALRARIEEREPLVVRYREALRPYSWPVEAIGDIRFAPFQLLASANEVLARRDHRWHIDVCTRLAAADGEVIVATPSRVVALDDPSAEEAAAEWWAERTRSGGEGMVVKPLGELALSRRVQPGIKVRGPEYLRIIYGPDYSLDGLLSRLRGRNVGRKRSLATREHALGLEALDRFVARDPLWRVHECVFGVLALESDPVDPRL